MESESLINVSKETLVEDEEAEKEALVSKLEMLQVEHDKIEFETENVEAANSNLKRELEEKNKDSPSP